MNWRYILGIGIAGGLFIGIGRAVGLNHWFVFPAMSVVLITAAAIIGAEGGKVGLNGFLTGCVTGIVQTTVVLLADPRFRMSGVSHDIRQFAGLDIVVIMVPVVALCWGVLLAIASWGASIIIERLVGKDTPEG